MHASPSPATRASSLSKQEGNIKCFIGLGANLNAPTAKLQAAIRAIAALNDCTSLSASSIYRSAPQETSESQPDYFNAVVSFVTTRSADSIWHDLQAIERSLGRTRSSERNAARVIDIDFLLYGDVRSSDPKLMLPHPRIVQRAFVLLPLLELAPEIVIPGQGFARAFLDLVKHQRIERVEGDSLLCN
jgi:2-amino-4-hydroxy-6-hydroxymethyldihydropteridine diphosphokinase